VTHRSDESAAVKIVSFRRSGLHYLAELLFRNLETGAPDREALHYSHSRVPGSPYVCIYRQAFPTLLSFWRMRRRFGVECSFADLLRVPFVELPSAPGGAYLDGAYVADAARPAVAQPLLDAWLSDTLRFLRGCAVAVPYDGAVAEPLRAVEAVQSALQLRRKPDFSVPFARVGWAPAAEEAPDVSEADLRLVAVAERQLRESAEYSRWRW